MTTMVLNGYAKSGYDVDAKDDYESDLRAWEAETRGSIKGSHLRAGKSRRSEALLKARSARLCDQVSLGRGLVICL